MDWNRPSEKIGSSAKGRIWAVRPCRGGIYVISRDYDSQNILTREIKWIIVRTSNLGHFCNILEIHCLGAPNEWSDDRNVVASCFSDKKHTVEGKWTNSLYENTVLPPAPPAKNLDRKVCKFGALAIRRAIHRQSRLANDCRTIWTCLSFVWEHRQDTFLAWSASRARHQYLLWSGMRGMSIWA